MLKYRLVPSPPYHTPARSRNSRSEVLSLVLVTSTALLSTALSQNEPPAALPEPAAQTSEPSPPPKKPLLARLGTTPDWSRLDAYQRSISRTEFLRLLHHNYLQNDKSAEGLIDILPDRARILKQSNQPELGYYELFFLSGAPGKSAPATQNPPLLDSAVETAANPGQLKAACRLAHRHRPRTHRRRVRPS